MNKVETYDMDNLYRSLNMMTRDFIRIDSILSMFGESNILPDAMNNSLNSIYGSLETGKQAIEKELQKKLDEYNAAFVFQDDMRTYYPRIYQITVGLPENLDINCTNRKELEERINKAVCDILNDYKPKEE